jgi:hypothetical protein
MNLDEVRVPFRYGITQPNAILCRFSEVISFPFEVDTGVSLVITWAKRRGKRRATCEHEIGGVKKKLVVLANRGLVSKTDPGPVRCLGQ